MTAVSHTERRTSHVANKHPIPPITDPMGTSWCQPARAYITIDDKYALMSKLTFECLAEYSCSQPSGVYPGKMWKRHDGAHDRNFIASGGKPEWWLCWFDFSERGPEWCTTQHRIILLSDSDINAKEASK